MVFDIKRVKFHRVKCPQCKANLLIRPAENVCPICGDSLPALKTKPQSKK